MCKRIFRFDLWQNIDFSRNCSEFHILTKIIFLKIWLELFRSTGFYPLNFMGHIRNILFHFCQLWAVSKGRGLVRSLAPLEPPMKWHFVQVNVYGEPPFWVLVAPSPPHLCIYLLFPDHYFWFAGCIRRTSTFIFMFWKKEKKIRQNTFKAPQDQAGRETRFPKFPSRVHITLGAIWTSVSTVGLWIYWHYIQERKSGGGGVVGIYHLHFLTWDMAHVTLSPLHWICCKPLKLQGASPLDSPFDIGGSAM